MKRYKINKKELEKHSKKDIIIAAKG